ncbi:MAG: sugar phosphate isomerase/epimerase, partial [Rhizobiaceae bacterium]
ARKWNLWGYIDARDGAQAVRRGIEAEFKGFEPFIIANADTVMQRSNASLMAEIFPNVPHKRELTQNGTLLSIDKARRLLDYAAQCLATADAVGARCAVSFIGSFAPGTRHGLDPRNLGTDAFDACVETARHLIDTVKPRRARFALEMMQATLPDSADSYLALIKAVDRSAFAAHLDPVNLVMTPRVYFDTGALIRECFAKLGPWIVSCHAKDITLHHAAALHLDEVQIGEGNLDYRTYLTELARLHDVPLMLEHLEPEQYAVARDRIFAFGDEAGVGFKHGPQTSA